MPRRRPRPGPHGSSMNDDAAQGTHHPAWRGTRQPRQSLLIAQRRADFKRQGAGLPTALCRQREARKRAGQDGKRSFGETGKGEGSPPGSGRGRPEPCRGLLRHRPLWPGRRRLTGSTTPSQTVDGLIVGSMTRGTAACDIAGTQDVPVFRWQGMGKALSGESDKTKTSHSHAGDVLANSGARDGT